MRLSLPVCLCAAALVAGCQAPAPSATPSTSTPAAKPERRYLLDRVEDVAVVQYYADGFEALPLRDKTLIWHLYQAAIAGRDIYYDQKHRDALAMRTLLEGVVAFPAHVDPKTLEAVQDYATLFWVNSGPYNNHSSRKFVLKTTPLAFAAAVRAAAADGARFQLPEDETSEAAVKRLERMFFDPAYDAVVTNKTPGPGQDILTGSANNLYSGVRMADLKGFTERYGLNSRLVKQDGRLVEEVYRLNGRYGAQIASITKHLTAALPFATPPMAEALKALIRWYETGEDADRKAYDIAWVKDNASPVDTVNGFIEVYVDPRGVKGGWEGIVSYVNQPKTARIKAIASSAQWFEDHMPWDPKYRKPNVTGIIANAIDVVIETGDSGPITPIGINLPNDSAIREQYGSKSVSLANINEAYDKSSTTSSRAEFAWSPEEVARAEQWGTLADELHTDMHEVIGHASGRLSPSMKSAPKDALREHYSAIEEGRADLVALYFIGDPKLVELGLVPAEGAAAIALNAYESYTRQALVQLRRVREGAILGEDHMRNRQMVVRWLLANTKAVEERVRDGKHYLVMVDPKLFREGVGRLLAEVQRIKSEGDYAAAAKLMETYGVRFDPALRDEVVRRVDKLKLPSLTGFVQPKLTPTYGPDGQISDVLISYPMSLPDQMLEWSGMKAATR